MKLINQELWQNNTPELFILNHSLIIVYIYTITQSDYEKNYADEILKFLGKKAKNWMKKRKRTMMRMTNWEAVLL